MRFLSVNVDSFLIELSSLEQTLALYRTLLRADLAAIQSLVPAAQTILVSFDPYQLQQQQLIQQISALDLDQDQQQQHQTRVIPIRYDGEDLAQVAELQGLSVQELIRRHHHSVWQVAFIGFAPGFAYMRSPDQPFGEIPRLAVPRKRIPAGALGLAGQYSGIYPKDSPGGWQWIGNSTEKMWDLSRANPALLLPGMTVQFEDVTHQPQRIQVPVTWDVESDIKSTAPPCRLEPAQLAVATGAQETENQVTAALRISAASLQMLIQDQGRFQQAHLGVGQAGAMDRSAMHSANRLVGNPIDSAVIELLGGGFQAQVEAPITLSISGAETRIQVDYALAGQSSQRCYYTSGQAIALDHGDRIKIEQPQAGLRIYLAIRGGFALSPVLGSYAYDSLAGLGPQPLQVGTVLYQGQAQTQHVAAAEIGSRHLPKVGDCVELDVLMGPRSDWFDAESLALLFEQAWQVSQDSNRVGLRLQGEQALTRSITRELESEGTCIGALQVPSSGQPVLFMHDHPLTGGYPVIAAVAPHHWDLVAQIPAGCWIKFKKIAELIDIECKS